MLATKDTGIWGSLENNLRDTLEQPYSLSVKHIKMLFSDNIPQGGYHPVLLKPDRANSMLFSANILT